MRDYFALEKIKTEIGMCISRAFDVGYGQGIEDGMKEKPQIIYDMKKEEYQRGLDDAWECARKICAGRFKGKLDTGMILNISASEAIAKIKEYEEKQKTDDEKENPCYHCYTGATGECEFANCKHRNEKWAKDLESEYLINEADDEIKVGDEVHYIAVPDTRFVVTDIIIDRNERLLSGFDKDGCQFTGKNAKNWIKTGRRFDAIKEVLKQMQEDKE